MIAALSDSQFQIVATALGLLIIGAWQSWLSYKQNIKTESVATKVASVETKVVKAEDERTETKKIIEKIHTDGNSRATEATEQNTRLSNLLSLAMSKIAVFEERLRPPVATAQGPQSVPIATAAPGGPITPVLAVPATLSGSRGEAVADSPAVTGAVTLTAEQFQQLLNRK